MSQLCEVFGAGKLELRLPGMISAHTDFTFVPCSDAFHIFGLNFETSFVFLFLKITSLGFVLSYFIFQNSGYFK